MRGVSKLLFNFAEDFLMALSAYHQASLKYSCYTLLFSIVQKQMKQLMINEKILIILLLFSACSQPDKSAKKWVEEAKCVDSVKIVGQNRYANINDFQVKGLTLQDIEKLYGHYNYAPLEHVKFDKPIDVKMDFSLLFLANHFIKSDYPVVISVYDWFRHPKINKMYPKVNNIWELSNHDGSLGMCMRVYFVEYEGKLIAFNALQTDCDRLYFLE